jgi:hypothetical protein
MTGESSLFSSYKPCAGNSKIKIVDGSLSAVAGKSSIVLFPLLIIIQDVLHVQNLSYNLLSVRSGIGPFSWPSPKQHCWCDPSCAFGVLFCLDKFDMWNKSMLKIVEIDLKLEVQVLLNLLSEIKIRLATLFRFRDMIQIKKQRHNMVQSFISSSVILYKLICIKTK